MTTEQAVSFSINDLANSVIDGLRALYYDDQRPWVVAYSGGKDSTLVLQLVYDFLIHEQRTGNVHKPIFVISSDTRVEAPNVASYVAKTLQKVAEAAEAHKLPLHTRLVTPQAEESYWGKLIGLGYPSPTRWFRWCTTNMKIKPSRRVIEEITREYGSVILLLGTRSSESANRSRSISGRDLNDRGLNPHHEIPNALVATPIVNWSTDEVWEYLYTNDPPWGGDHNFMLSLYRQANSGECPVVLDLNTPSCGGSRFGCWTCTVVKEDKSLQGFIESGEAWMQPLNEFRNWLKDIREESQRRSPLRRDGRSAGPGPFNPKTRMEILDRLLSLEQKVKFTLIADEDLAYIQQEWAKEFDYEQTVGKLAAKYGREVFMDLSKSANAPENDLLEKCAVDADFPPELARQLLETARCYHGNLDRWGAKKELQTALSDLIKKDVNQSQKADPAHDI